MEWRDEGMLLSARRHGETSAIIEVFTAAHGRHLGVLRGGASRKMSGVLQPGTQLDVVWRARLEDHIGVFTIEPVRSRAVLMTDRMTLAGLNAVCALLQFALGEREAHPNLYAQTLSLLDFIEESMHWPIAYLRWEMALLEELGFGLDLSGCAVTGVNERLDYISPRTGRAVSAEGAGDWANRLLPLPPEMLGKGTGEPRNILAGLTTTGFFLDHRLAPDLGQRPVPEARSRLIARLEQAAR